MMKLGGGGEMRFHQWRFDNSRILEDSVWGTSKDDEFWSTFFKI